jgi:phosphopantetheinyl transferase
VIRGFNNTQVSISHVEGFGVAVIFDDSNALGIDLEKISPEKFQKVFRLVLTLLCIQLIIQAIIKIVGNSPPLF